MGSGAWEGKKLGKYRLMRLLGRGGMAEVYLAEHEMLESRVAVKVLPPELAADPDMVARFLREARAAAALRHPHIVRIHDVGQEGGANYFAMDYVEGRSLSELIAGSGALDESCIVGLSRQVLSALAEAHAHGIIHRDIKPDNVLVDQRGDAVVMDFGIAKAARSTRVTQAGTFLGTVAYSSPEQARGREIDPRSDLYSWGVVMYEMATGRAPFGGGDTSAVVYQHVHEVPRPPSEMAVGLSPGLTAFILKALEKRPADRFASAAAALDELEALAGPGGATGGHSTKGTSIVGAGQARAARAKSLLDEATAQLSRRQWAAALALAEKAQELDPTLARAGETADRARRELAGEERTQALSDHAADMEAQGRFAEAAGLVAELVKVTPDKTAALDWLERLQAAQKSATEVEAGLQRGRALEAAGELERAAELYRDLSRSFADDPRPGQALEELVQSKQAADLARRAAEKVAAGDLAGAAQDYQASLELRPGQSETRRALEELSRRISRGQRSAALVARAEELLSAGDGKGALAALSEALSLAPEHARAKELLPRAQAAAHAQAENNRARPSDPTVVMAAPGGAGGAPPDYAPPRPEPSIDAPPPEPPAAPPARRSRAGLWVAVVILVLAGAAGAWWWSQQALVPEVSLTTATRRIAASSSTTTTVATTSRVTSTTRETTSTLASSTTSTMPTSTMGSTTMATTTMATTSTLPPAALKADAQAARGRELLAQGDLEGAALAYRQALVWNPNHAAALDGLDEINRRQQAQAAEQRRQDALRAADEALQQGRQALATGRLDLAEQAFKRALQADPDNPEARDGLARVAEARRAEADQERRAQTRAQVQDLMRQGRDHLSKGRLDQAEGAFRQAFGLDPQAQEALDGLAAVAAHRKEVARKEAEAKRLAEEKRRAEEERRRTAQPEERAVELLAQGEKEAARGRFDRAEKLWQRALAALPGYAPAQKALADLPRRRAARAAGEADAEVRRQAQLAKVQGVTEFNRRNYDAAVKHFEHYNKVFPNDAEGLKYLAQARQWAKASRFGTLNVDSSPRAQVYVDGRLVGQTPLRDAEVAVGRRHLEVRAYGGKAGGNLVIKPATAAAVKLVIKGGSLMVTSQPRAELYLDGAHCGTTPIELGNLRVGPRRILLRQKGYRDLEKEVVVRGDRTEKLVLNLSR